MGPDSPYDPFGQSLSAFRGSPETPEMLCGLRLQGPLLMHPGVALGSALTARGPSGGPFGPALGRIGRALRARPGSGPSGPSPAAGYLPPPF